MHAALARLVNSEEARKQEKIDQIPLPETPLTEQSYARHMSSARASWWILVVACEPCEEEVS